MAYGNTAITVQNSWTASADSNYCVLSESTITNIAYALGDGWGHTLYSADGSSASIKVISDTSYNLTNKSFEGNKVCFLTKDGSDFAFLITRSYLSDYPKYMYGIILYKKSTKTFVKLVSGISGRTYYNGDSLVYNFSEKRKIILLNGVSGGKGSNILAEDTFVDSNGNEFDCVFTIGNNSSYIFGGNIIREDCSVMAGNIPVQQDISAGNVLSLFNVCEASANGSLASTGLYSSTTIGTTGPGFCSVGENYFYQTGPYTTEDTISTSTKNGTTVYSYAHCPIYIKTN